MSFLFVDRVLHLTCNESIVAVRQVTIAEEVLQHHFPGNPVFPASLVVEACAQAATILIETSAAFRHKAFVGFIEKAKFRLPIRPGYEMKLELVFRQSNESGAVIRCRVLQRDRKCASMDLGMVTTPMAEFIPIHLIPHYLELYRPWLAEASCDGFDVHPLEGLPVRES